MHISVVLPALIKNDYQYKMTLQCIDRAKKYTKVPFELIIVETASDYLIDMADVYIYEKYITNATFSINRGMSASYSDYVVFLSNDVMLENRWLECMIDCFHKNEDCGLSTVATTQLGHTKQDIIKEGIWFSVAMIPKEEAWFDTRYVNSWDDSDLITRVYLKGKKMYRNYNCLVSHNPGQTQYGKSDHEENFDRNRKLYCEKWYNNRDSKIYEIITKGIVI